jgi:membrane protein implicated in regulation of membrane protease activity
MGKWILIAVRVVAIAIFVIVAVYLLNKVLSREVTEETSLTYKHKMEVERGEIVTPKVVKVTVGDSLYHDLDCDWAGKTARKMKLDDAVELGFYPCPQCMAEE